MLFDSLFSKEKWVRILLFSALTILLYHLGFLALVFAVPLQILAIKEGKQAFLTGALLTGVMILLISGVTEGGQGALRSLLVSVTLLGGLYVVNFQMLEHRRLLRLLVVTLGVGILSVPVFSLLHGQASRLVADEETLSALISTLFRTTLAGTGEVSEADALAAFDKIILQGFAAFYFFVLAWIVGLGDVFTRRVSTKEKLKRFILPGWVVWMYLIPQSVHLLSAIFAQKGILWEMGIPGHILTNVGFIGVGLFTLQGLGLSQYFIAKWGGSSTVQGAALAGIVVVILLLGRLGWVSIMVQLAVLFLGLSEVWLKYRKRDLEGVER